MMNLDPTRNYLTRQHIIVVGLLDHPFLPTVQKISSKPRILVILIMLWNGPNLDSKPTLIDS